jgi:hypothetical protein
MKILVTCLFFALASATSITIELKNGSKTESLTKAQLEKLLSAYDLSKYTFTRNVLIEDKAVPHSNPVLTLNTRYLDSDDKLLTAYIHEQLHWYLDARTGDTQQAETALRKLYPKVPVGYPNGAKDEESTYLHLIDCYLELKADQNILGRERAAALLHFLENDHYRWIYQTIERDNSAIGAVVERAHLSPEG